MRRLALLAAAVLAPTLPAAQPRLVPTGDVAVVYRVSGAAADRIPGGAPDGVRLEWDAAGQRLRTEPLGRPAYAITDLTRRVADIVFPAQTSFLELPLRGGDPQALLAGADTRFTRRGAGRVLGMDCTEWTVRSHRLDATGCVTADGVVLRADGVYEGERGAMEATSVVRGPLPPAHFAPPQGYFRVPMGGAR